MISLEQVELVRSLFDKMSRREIAKMTGISRGTIQRIAAGKTTGYFGGRVITTQPKFKLPKVTCDINKLEYVRCPTCGGKVQAGIPCYACDLRKYLNDKHSRNY